MPTCDSLQGSEEEADAVVAALGTCGEDGVRGCDDSDLTEPEWCVDFFCGILMLTFSFFSLFNSIGTQLTREKQVKNRTKHEGRKRRNQVQGIKEAKVQNK